MNLKIPTRTVHVEDEMTERDTFTASWVRHSNQVFVPATEEFTFDFDLALSPVQNFNKSDTLPAPSTWILIHGSKQYTLDVFTSSNATYFQPSSAVEVGGLDDTIIYSMERNTRGNRLRFTFKTPPLTTQTSPISITVSTTTRTVAFARSTATKTVDGIITSVTPSSGTVYLLDMSVEVDYTVSGSGAVATAQGTTITVLNASAISTASEFLGTTDSGTATINYNAISYDYYYTATSSTHNYDGDVDTATYVSGTRPTTIHKSGKTVYCYWYSSSYKSGSVSAQLDVTYDVNYDEERANVYFNGQLVDYVYFNGEKFPK